MGELVVIVTFEPQGVHDSGIHHNHQQEAKGCQAIPLQILISLAHPLLGPVKHTQVAFLVKLPSQERRDIEY